MCGGDPAKQAADAAVVCLQRMVIGSEGIQSPKLPLKFNILDKIFQECVYVWKHNPHWFHHLGWRYLLDCKNPFTINHLED